MLSIKSRFLLVSLASVGIALTGAGFVFIHLFAKSLERRVDAELGLYINQIAAQLSFDKSGALLAPRNLADTRFMIPYGGLYWQIDGQDGIRLRSRSLWDYALPLTVDVREPGRIYRYRLTGPDGHGLITEERQLVVATPAGARKIRITVALDSREIRNARDAFAKDMIPYMIGLAIFLVVASGAQLSFGLRPIALVRDGLHRIRERRRNRLDGNFPAELQGVVDAVNRLLEAQDVAMARARTRASDLAHGLNTPLAVLANDANTLREKGEIGIAAELETLIHGMQAHVAHELTRSRIVTTPEQRRSDASVAKIAGEVVRVLRRTPKGETLCMEDGYCGRPDARDRSA